MTNNTYQSQFVVLKNFLENKHNVKVVLNPGAFDAWYPALSRIHINKNLKWRERFFTLLHEAGHALIDTDLTIKHKTCFGQSNPANVRSRREFVHTINNEIMAWNKGKEIAEMLNFIIGTKKFEEYMTNCIMSHVKHGLKELYGREINVTSIRDC